MMSFKTVGDYIKKQPEEPRILLNDLRNKIKKLVPDATETISYQMPAFKHNDRMLIYYAGFRDHCSLFPASSKIMKLKDVQKYKTSTGTLQFKKPFPLSLLKKIIAIRLEENLARGKK
jgi:uncharacterized protein YdhG (YjbR/CyaY superfamily)